MTIPSYHYLFSNLCIASIYNFYFTFLLILPFLLNISDTTYKSLYCLCNQTKRRPSQAQSNKNKICIGHSATECVLQTWATECLLICACIVSAVGTVYYCHQSSVMYIPGYTCISHDTKVCMIHICI